MNNKPFVSILIPVYGAEKYLRRCLDSILNQDFEDMEVILVNDASPDASLSIMEEYAAKDSRFKIIQHDQNYGRVKARKTAINAACGTYIAFCDADDELLPSFLQKAFAYSSSGPFDLIHFGTQVADTSSLRIHAIFERYTLPHGKILHKDKIFDTYFLENKFIPHLWGNLWNASLLKQHLPSEIPHCINDDFLIMTHLMYYVNTMLYIRKRVYRYHYGAGTYGKKTYTLSQFRQFVNNIESFRELSCFFHRVSLPPVYHEALEAKKRENCLYTLEILSRLPNDQQEQGMTLLFDAWGKEEISKTFLLQYMKIAHSIPGRIRSALCVLYDLGKYYIPSLLNHFEWRISR